MPVISFTPEEKEEAMLPAFTAAGEVAIGIENADDCEGIRCGERLESAFSAEQYAQWIEFHAERPPVAPHSHMVVRGADPKTRANIFAIFKETPYGGIRPPRPRRP